MDNRGNSFELEDAGEGNYRVWIGQEYLEPGTAYKVTVTTPSGEQIESAYDTLTQGASLGSVYYQIEDIPTGNPDIMERHMQFYVDLDAPESASRFYKWDVVETWEFHSRRPAEYYYDGKFHQLIPPDYSKMVCWGTVRVKEVFVLSTKGLAHNKYQKQPMHFVDGNTSRLGIQYSFLVSQQSLSQAAFNYFETVKTNNAGFAGLYEQQPFSIKGNMVNLTHPEMDVLGYFYATTESSRRYFYKDVEGMELDFWDGCTEDHLPLTGWAGYKKIDYPVYYYYTESGELLILSDVCIDCRLRGGTLTKPDFWPE
jgi:hypothetical protein